jgi:hypothetical protein
VTEKNLLHYVLFGPPGRPQTPANMLLALGYVLRFGPTFGFSVNEAAHAELVTIVGDEESINSAQETYLLEHGCRVLRVAGTSHEIGEKLADLEEQGTPFGE